MFLIESPKPLSIHKLSQSIMKVGCFMNNSYLDCLAVLGVGGAHPGGLKLTKELLAQEKMNESTKILDAGCGTGQTSAYIAKKYGCDVTAVDQNKIMVEKANKRFSAEEISIKAIEGTMENLPFANDSFDFILSESVMLFTNITQSITELKRVLKPGGKLLAIEMVREKKMNDAELVTLKSFYENTHFHSEEEWKQNLNQAKFKVIQVDKPKVQFDPEDLDTVPEYSLSELVDPAYFEMMKAHEEMLELYKSKLSFCVFKCTK